MSILFLKSQDRSANTNQYNPNKPYRFSNYLTQPLTIPPNSQVAYVSSQFNILPNGELINQPSYILTTSENNSVMTMPVMMAPNTTAPNIDSGFKDFLNQYALSSNESGMEDDFTGLKYTTISAFGETQEVSDYGFQMLYDVANDKPFFKTIMRTIPDQYNLGFNSLRSNPSFNSGNWVIGGSGLTGATISPGMNFGTLVDAKFQTDSGCIRENAPSGTSSFKGANNYGVRPDRETNIGNARNVVYEGGANYYNVGWRVDGLDGNAAYYDNQTLNAGAISLPPFDEGRYPVVMSKVGIKKCVGDITPNNSQQNNRGGHQTIGHLQSGGYALWTITNANQIVQNQFYDVGSCPKEGFTGFMECSVGVNSLPWVQKQGYQDARDAGETDAVASSIQTQLKYWNINCDLNNGTALSADSAYARYLFGMDFRLDGTAPNITLKAQAKMAQCFPSYSDIGSSTYIDAGNALDLYQLSRGVNTATTPAYTFDATANYSINCFNTTAGRTAAMLFFRFRWDTKTTMVIEFTLSVDGYAGTYDNATDEPYAPSTEATFPTPPGAEADPRNKWCLLARMDIGTKGVGQHPQNHIPPNLGDMCLMTYPIAWSPSTSDYYYCTKGHYNIRLTNRVFSSNFNGSKNYIAPYGFTNPFFTSDDYLGILQYDPNAPDDETKTSEQFISSGWKPDNLIEFNTNGILQDEINVLGVPLKDALNKIVYLNIAGDEVFDIGEPNVEIFYQLGFNRKQDPTDILDLVTDPGDATGATQFLEAVNDIQPSSSAFSNHIQLTNLPIISQNGVVSSVNKTIYVVNTLCIDSTHDTLNYRSYCDKSPYPLWVDLNNYETIQLNKIDVLITKDNNTENKNLDGETEIVVLFRQKETGTLLNAIPTQSVPITRSY